MRWVKNRGLRYLQFSNLSTVTGLIHGVLTRFCENQGKVHPFDLGLNCGQASESVWSNRKRMLETFRMKSGVFARQVHGTGVAIWPDGGFTALGDDRKGVMLADALATASIGNALVIQVADCQSIMLVDPVERVVANVHSGWRGSIHNIIAHTVETMTSHWGCRPRNILCGIGPSLGPCCAEFVNYRNEIPSIFWDYRCSEYHFDFWQISKDQLLEQGISADHIELSNLCTKCNQHLFFSYRGHKQTGRFATLIGWPASPSENEPMERLLK